MARGINHFEREQTLKITISPSTTGVQTFAIRYTRPAGVQTFACLAPCLPLAHANFRQLKPPVFYPITCPFSCFRFCGLIPCHPFTRRACCRTLCCRLRLSLTSLHQPSRWHFAFRIFARPVELAGLAANLRLGRRRQLYIIS